MIDEESNQQPDGDQIPENAVCPACGYALRGLPSNVCPECGKEFDPVEVCQAATRRKPYWFEHRFVFVPMCALSLSLLLAGLLTAHAFIKGRPINDRNFRYFLATLLAGPNSFFALYGPNWLGVVGLVICAPLVLAHMIRPSHETKTVTVVGVICWFGLGWLAFKIAVV